METRLEIKSSEQIDFFKQIKVASKLNVLALSKLCGVSERTFRSWQNAQYTPTEKAVAYLSELFEVAIPSSVKKLDSYWYIAKASSLGGKKRFELYGPPGNVETRKEAGRISQLKRKLDPKKYLELGCIVVKPSPDLKPSEDLAELVGVILGDGGITNGQIKITLNRLVDFEYSKYVSELIRKLLQESPAIYERENVLNLCVSGVLIVKAFLDLGLKTGNKVKNQVGIPKWILDNPDFAKKAVRGLFDTDGCIYLHNHIVKGKSYVNGGVTLTNHSRPIITQVVKVLNGLGINAKVSMGTKVYIYDFDHIKRYMEFIDTSNPKHLLKFEKYLKLKSI